MKIKLSKLLPNPYRDIGNYTINKARVAKLQGSILSTEFWGGLVCRPHPTKETKKGFYQIAFGHHRIQALKNLKYNEISIKVLDYTDIQMLKAMAEENREIGQHDIKIMTQTVEQVKKYLDEELTKYKIWKDVPQSLINLLGLSKRHKFEDIKTKGVGQITILKFLGDTWKQSEIGLALSILKEDEAGTIDRKAVELFNTKYQAEEFKNAVIDTKIPINKQKEIAKKIKSKVNPKKRIKGQTKGGRAIKDEVAKFSPVPKTKSKPKKIDLNEYINDVADSLDSLTRKIENIRQAMKRNPKVELPSSISALFASISAMGITLKEFSADLSKRNPMKQQKMLNGQTKRKQIKSKTRN